MFSKKRILTAVGTVMLAAATAVSCNLTAEPPQSGETSLFRQDAAPGPSTCKETISAEAVFTGDIPAAHTTAEPALLTDGCCDRQLKTAPLTLLADDIANVPILMYHHVHAKSKEDTAVSPENFEKQLKAMKAAGYHTVTTEDLLNFVHRGVPLPPKPFCITFDDGYLSNYEFAYPLLAKYEMEAVIFTVGITMGQSTYKETGEPIKPHFSAAQAKEMADSGVIDIQSHTYDMHQWQPLEEETARENILIFEDESEKDYAALLKADCQKEAAALRDATGKEVVALSFPGCEYDDLSQKILKEAGIQITFAGDFGVNIIRKGDPQSLLTLCRLNVNNKTTPRRLLSYLSGAQN